MLGRQEIGGDCPPLDRRLTGCTSVDAVRSTAIRPRPSPWPMARFPCGTAVLRTWMRWAFTHLGQRVLSRDGLVVVHRRA
jgi:hypothetical protein